MVLGIIGLGDELGVVYVDVSNYIVRFLLVEWYFYKERI